MLDDYSLPFERYASQVKYKLKSTVDVFLTTSVSNSYFGYVTTS
jgi:hypothetical protein